MTSTALRGLRSVAKKPSLKKEIVIETTELFQSYVEALAGKQQDQQYSLCTLVNGNMHYIIEDAVPKDIINALVFEFLNSEDRSLPFYYLKVHLIGSGVMTQLLPRQKYDEIKANENVQASS